MFPLKDVNPSFSYPYVTKSLIALNTAIFFLTFFRDDYPLIVETWGFKPIYLYTGVRLETLFTSMFLHGDLHHLLGNMVFLWIFGDNVEDALGHFRFLVFYLSSGVFAAFIQSIFSNDPFIVMIGASGAISGVLGIYILFFPYARILTLVFYFFITIIEIPAYHFIWIWFVVQVINGTFSLLAPQPIGVAYWAHIGGFVFGLALGYLFRDVYRVRVKRDAYRHWIIG